MDRTQLKAVIAETIGTMLLVATVVGSGIMAEAVSGGNMGVALLGNTLATGAMLVVLITVFGPLSGAHFNPAVTLAFLVRKEITLGTACAFIVFQISGGMLGSWLAHIMFDLPIIQIAQNARSGLAQYFSEMIATSGLLMVIFGGIAYRPQAVPLLVGLYISAGYWFTASTSFANPAVTLARTFTDSFSGITPLDMPFFILAQLLAVLPITLLCAWLFAQENASE